MFCLEKCNTTIASSKKAISHLAFKLGGFIYVITTVFHEKKMSKISRKFQKQPLN